MDLISQLDDRLGEFSTKLRDDLAIEPPSSLKLATTIYNEIRALPIDKLPTLAGESPLSLKDRHEQLMAVLEWWRNFPADRNNCGLYMTLNYFCFVYLSESCFKILRKELPPGSIARKCCEYLTDNPVRAFRNAVAHGNWRATLDGSAIDFWARKGSQPDEAMSRFRFTVNDLNFCYCLSIATAHAAMLAL
jgi:hypothetical protein